MRRLPILLACLALLAPALAGARTLQARVARVATPVATLEQVRMRVDWAADATSGELQLWAARVDAPDLGYRWRDLHWRCPLQREADAGWRCAGALRAGNSAPLRLEVAFDAASTRAALSRGAARFALERDAATPDLTTLDLRAVPVAWAQALVAQAWADARFTGGTLAGRLLVDASAGGAVGVEGPLRLRGVALETADASIAAEGVAADLAIRYRSAAAGTTVDVDGLLRGGQLLAGNTYIALPETPVGLEVAARRATGAGWRVPRLVWRDGAALQATAALAFEAAGALERMSVDAHSDDLAPVRQRYLSGWLGLAGLGELDLHGGLQVAAEVDAAGLSRVDARLHGVDIRDPAQRFVFDGLEGDLRYSADTAVDSALAWRGGKLYGLEFGAARLPFASAEGVLRFRDDAPMPFMGGRLTVHDVVIRPPRGEAGADIRFGLVVDDVDFGRVSQVVGLPAFQGRLSGAIPNAHYANERVDFDGGLSMQLFDGQVVFTSLALERPFGTAPSLGADITFEDLDLLRLTEVLGFGSVTGRLDGRIDGLRLVDWTPVAFDAWLESDPAPGVPQRISQSAVQDISSVGDASFVTSLQGRLIGFFDDFGYRRLGIGCRLANEVCSMAGLPHSHQGQGQGAFTIVQGAGLPRLDVVGYNRSVDWPTLVERLRAVGSGEVAPVVE